MKANSDSHRRSSTVSSVSTSGVRIYHKPSFVVQRDANRRLFCKDSSGRLVAEFAGMTKLTEYVAAQTGKSKNYIKQQVYKSLNKNTEFLGYHWSDR
jgi:hypothetical protein